MVKITSLKEFLPERPVMFDPPKLMYVWNGFDDADSLTLADVAYVNPSLSVNRVLAFGMDVSARNMGTTWNHCAECCTTLGNHERDALVQDSARKEESPEQAETTGMGAKAIYDYLSDKKDDAKITTDCMRHEGPIVTYRELSEWLSRGKGQVLIGRMNDAIVPPSYSNTIAYAVGLDNETVPWERTACTGETYYRVRKYGDNKPSAPTRQYMEVPDPGYSSVAVPDSVAYNLGLMPGQCFHAYSSNQPDWNAYTKEGRNG